MSPLEKFGSDTLDLYDSKVLSLGFRDGPADRYPRGKLTAEMSHLRIPTKGPRKRASRGREEGREEGSGENTAGVLLMWGIGSSQG